MNLENWITWTQKQLSDLSMRLLRQGYQPALIEYLNQTQPEFREVFEGTLARLDAIMENMAANPDGYHHFEDFSQEKQSLLNFTNTHRETYLSLNLAQTA